MINASYNKLIAFDGKIIDTSHPIVMAIINITPDSFFKNSRVNTEESILKSAQYAIENGASILDIGGYSTRPGADVVTEEEEIERVAFALSTIRSHFPNIPISIDTFRGNVAHVAVKDFGVGMINDVSGFEWDENMLDAIKSIGLFCITKSPYPKGIGFSFYNYLKFFKQKFQALVTISTTSLSAFQPSSLYAFAGSA